MSNSNEIQQLEQSIKQAKEHVDFAAALERLRSNRDFTTVITKGYFEDESIRLVHLKADPKMQSAANQADIVRQMDAVGSLNQYFQVKMHLARLAMRSITADEETIEELSALEVQ